MKRESKPHYLQDTILPKETERKGGFDLDREFGQGTAEKIRDVFLVPETNMESFTNWTEGRVGLSNYPKMRRCADYRIAFHVNPPGLIDLEMVAANLEYLFQKIIHRHLTSGKTGGEILKMNRVFFGNDTIGNEEERINFLSQFHSFADKNLDDFEIACAHRILFGSDEALRSIMSKTYEGRLRQLITRDMRARRELRALKTIAALRTLRAHDIKFIPGKGIEIIDDPPAEFEKKTEPLPEERKF